MVSYSSEIEITEVFVSFPRRLSLGVETVVVTFTLLLASICSMLMGRMEETTSPGLTSTKVKIWGVLRYTGKIPKQRT